MLKNYSDILKIPINCSFSTLKFFNKNVKKLQWYFQNFITLFFLKFYFKNSQKGFPSAKILTVFFFFKFSKNVLKYHFYQGINWYSLGRQSLVVYLELDRGEMQVVRCNRIAMHRPQYYNLKWKYMVILNFNASRCAHFLQCSRYYWADICLNIFVKE